eukprot:6865779-Prymnesium_polylepis.1
MRTSDVSTTLTLGRNERRPSDPLPPTARAGGTQQSSKSLDRSLVLRLTDSAQSPCALDARLSKLIQTRPHPPDSQMRTHACG